MSLKRVGGIVDSCAHRVDRRLSSVSPRPGAWDRGRSGEPDRLHEDKSDEAAVALQRHEESYIRQL